MAQGPVAVSRPGDEATKSANRPMRDQNTGRNEARQTPDKLKPDQVLPAPLTWKPAAVSSLKQTNTDYPGWLRSIFKIPVLGWALECVLDERTTVRVTGMSVLVMSALLSLLALGRSEWVIPMVLVSGMLIAGYRVFR